MDASIVSAITALRWTTGVALVLSLAFLGGSLCAPAIAASAPAAMTVPGASLPFAGRSWSIKAGAGLLGPGPNLFSGAPENVWVDAAGRLHLRITNRDGQWQAAEVILSESLGYGTYSFTVDSPIGTLDPNVVLGLFTWSDDPAYDHREIDVEFARWGNAGGPTNAQNVVQSNPLASSLNRFVQPSSAPSVHTFTWAHKSVTFASRTAGGQSIASWRYKGSGVPRPGGERTHINLWLDHGTPPVNGAAVEVVLSNFSFAR
jgi:hypothetical protein